MVDQLNASLDISVVICTYTEERWDYLIKAVESIQHQSVPPLEIIVVVDHNLNLLRRMVTYFQNVKVVENSGPQGLADARNSGVLASKGRFVAFLDDDAIAEPEWLVRLVEGYRDSNVIGVGGVIEPIWLDKHPQWFPREFYWIIGCTYRGMPQTTAPVRNLIGCNMSFRREALKEIGGFRSGIGRVGASPVGCEETEFCIRALQRWPDAIILFEPPALVFHQITPNRATWTYFRKRCYGEGISKALISQSVGVKDGLSSERAYALCTLPRGVTQGIVDTLFRGDMIGVTRSAALLAGLTFTTAGYIKGWVSEGIRNIFPNNSRPTPGGERYHDQIFGDGSRR